MVSKPHIIPRSGMGDPVIRTVPPDQGVDYEQLLQDFPLIGGGGSDRPLARHGDGLGVRARSPEEIRAQRPRYADSQVPGAFQQQRGYDQIDAFNQMRQQNGGDPTGIFTTQELRYGPGNVGPFQGRMANDLKHNLPHRWNAKQNSDTKIRTYLDQMAQQMNNAGRGDPRDVGASARRAGGYGAGMTPGARERKASPLESLYQQFQSAHDSANRANEERYQQLVGGLQNRYSRNMATLEGLGTQERSDYQPELRQPGCPAVPGYDLSWDGWLEQPAGRPAGEPA